MIAGTPKDPEQYELTRGSKLLSFDGANWSSTLYVHTCDEQNLKADPPMQRRSLNEKKKPKKKKGKKPKKPPLLSAMRQDPGKQALALRQIADMVEAAGQEKEARSKELIDAALREQQMREERNDAWNESSRQERRIALVEKRLSISVGFTWGWFLASVVGWYWLIIEL